jgi:hypothetical protein
MYDQQSKIYDRINANDRWILREFERLVEVCALDGYMAPKEIAISRRWKKGRPPSPVGM